MATDERTCQGCRLWVAHNRSDDLATRGECTLPLSHRGGPTFRVVPADGLARVEAAMVVMDTPFDWSCAGWAARPATADDAQCSPG